jgi:hypothetical protein
MIQFTARPALFEESIREQMKAPQTERSKEFYSENRTFRQNRDIPLSREELAYHLAR